VLLKNLCIKGHLLYCRAHKFKSFFLLLEANHSCVSTAWSHCFSFRPRARMGLMGLPGRLDRLGLGWVQCTRRLYWDKRKRVKSVQLQFTRWFTSKYSNQTTLHCHKNTYRTVAITRMFYSILWEVIQLNTVTAPYQRAKRQTITWPTRPS